MCIESRGREDHNSTHPVAPIAALRFHPVMKEMSNV
jgi:hypothetical protein